MEQDVLAKECMNLGIEFPGRDDEPLRKTSLMNSALQEVHVGKLFQHFLNRGFEYVVWFPVRKDVDLKTFVFWNARFGILCYVELWTAVNRFNTCYLHAPNSDTFQGDSLNVAGEFKVEWRVELSAHPDSLDSIVNFDTTTPWTRLHICKFCLGTGKGDYQDQTLQRFEKLPEHIKKFVYLSR